MIIPCFRCGKEIDSPDASKADYIIAPDTVVKESREVLVALSHNQATLEKLAKMEEVDEEGNPKYPDMAIADNEYDAIEIPNLESAKSVGENLVKVIVGTREKDIQKTGVICPKCYNPDTDTLIWGVHKK